MGKVTLTRFSGGRDGIEYSIVWNPSVEERRHGAERSVVMLTKKEFASLMEQGLAFVGSKVKVVE
jgi:hypothetical protein